MAAFETEKVLWIKHWNDRLFTFATTRRPEFRFESGQFVMVGLMAEGKPLLRAYSVASPNYADDLEFFSIKVQDGPLTSRLQHIKEGDEVLVGKKPVGIPCFWLTSIPAVICTCFPRGRGWRPFSR